MREDRRQTRLGAGCWKERQKGTENPPRASVGSWAGLACTGIDWARDPAHSTLHAPEPGQAIGLGAGTKLEAIMVFLTTENKSLAHLKRDGGEIGRAHV